MRLRTMLLFVALLLTAAACSSATSEGVTAAESSNATDQDADSQTSDPQTSAASDEATNSAATVPARDPAATLTIGDQTWTFDVLICAISIAEEGQVAAGSTITALNDDTRFAITSHPSSGSYADFTDFEPENPAIDFSSDAESTSIILEKDSFSGTGEFDDEITESLDLIPGSFSGTCS